MTKHMTRSLIASLILLPGVAAADLVGLGDMDLEPIGQDLLTTVKEALPEGYRANSSFLQDSYNPNLQINQDAQVNVTYIWEGAGYRNSLGYFTYTDNTFAGTSQADFDTDRSGRVSLAELAGIDGVKTGMIFDNVSGSGSGGSLDLNDNVWLGGGEVFEAGTNIGFFLVQNAYTGSRRNPVNTSKQTFYTLDFLNPEAGYDATLNTSSADNSSRHAAMMFADENKKDGVILGFEDLNRTDRTTNDWRINSDNDFNDAVFLVRSNPVSAFAKTDIPTAPAPLTGTTLAGLLFAGLAWRTRRRKA